jgi:hypothetical protein
MNRVTVHLINCILIAECPLMTVSTAVPAAEAQARARFAPLEDDP